MGRRMGPVSRCRRQPGCLPDPARTVPANGPRDRGDRSTHSARTFRTRNPIGLPGRPASGSTTSPERPTPFPGQRRASSASRLAVPAIPDRDWRIREAIGPASLPSLAFPTEGRGLPAKLRTHSIRPRAPRSARKPSSMPFAARKPYRVGQAPMPAAWGGRLRLSQPRKRDGQAKRRLSAPHHGVRASGRRSDRRAPGSASLHCPGNRSRARRSSDLWTVRHRPGSPWGE